MKISGVTFVRNAVQYDYPITESIRSILHICDEVIVLVGNSDDGTKELVQSINNPKIKIQNSIWDESQKQGGKIYALETNKALSYVDTNADWIFYIQADEIFHEQYTNNVFDAMHQWKYNTKVDGLLLQYHHFYGSYNYIGASSQWYTHEIRIIRNDKNIYSYRDAQGFRKGNNEKLSVKPVNAFMYHYGWVREPHKMQKKISETKKFYQNNSIETQSPEAVYEGVFDYSHVHLLKKFTGTHPNVMFERINNKNWKFERDISQSKYTLKDRIKKFLKLIGINTYYRNYKII
ncbi:MAG: glycosyltransferase family 2 protein [Chitinophagaceae bacterium]|nr:glycosyltransferase family 2 protein [Chitinophagaceae bacterium]